MSDTHFQDRSVAAEQNIKEREYWMQQFSEEFTKSHFLYDYELSDIKNNRTYKTVKFPIPQHINDRLNHISNGSDVRLFIVMASTLIILLNKYTGNRDITVGVPIYKQTVQGEYINTVLPIRYVINSNDTYKETLLAISQAVLQANENQNYSIYSLLYNLKMNDTGDLFPLFDVAVLLDTIHSKEDIVHTRPNVIVSFSRTEAGLTGCLEYNVSLFKKSTIERISNHYINCLSESLFNMDRQVGLIDILSTEEKEWLIHGLNDTQVELSIDSVIHLEIEKQVQKTPEREAVVFDNRILTYDQLNKKANQLAHLLRENGAVPDQVIPVMFDRSDDMIVALLAVLKSGAAYLPIDPELPIERIVYMLEESKSKLLLSNEATMKHSAHITDKESKFGIKLLLLDELEHTLNRMPVHNLAHISKPDHLAYVMFTSGSTGKPKGVMLEHRNVTNVLNWFNRVSGLKEGDKVLSTYEYTSDPSVEDFFSTLMLGATLYVTDKYLVIDRERFRAFVNEKRISILNFVPRIIQELLCNGEKLESLHTVLSGGETLEDAVKDELLRIGYKVYNDYGPTEAAVDCLSQCCSDQKVTIGRPIDNMKCYILDQENRIQPVGVAGELCISGAGIARGYMNKPDLTKKKFVLNPFVTGERMYRTGDVARIRENGEIEFLGRADRQVKIRGYRVELDEIEHQLMKSDDVQEAFVMAREDARAGKQIFAYVVMKPGRLITDLKWKLGSNIPGYMMPTYFIKMDNIPLTATGKVNLKALPSTTSVEEYPEMISQPESQMERMLANIWMEVLDLKTISTTSNFFEIGGHSLSIIRIKSKIYQLLGKEVPVVTLFQYSTIESLARYLTGQDSQQPIHDTSSDVETMDETLHLLRGLSNE